MTAITRRQILAGGALALPLVNATLSSAAEPTDKEIEKLVNVALRAWEVPGVAVGIVHEGKVIHLAGYGVKKLGGKDKVTPDTLFPIASCTKAFTTTALAMLVSKGKMLWDDPVRNYLEYFRLFDPSADRLVTLRDLLCHRTGLGSHDLLWYRAAWSQREAVRRIGRVPPNLEFRSSFRYQSTMVAAAGYALEAVLDKGRTWEGFVRDEILKPLGMNRTFCTTKEAFQQNDIATPHRENRKDELKAVDWYEINVPDPAGSIVSCARDLCQWALFHLRQWALFHLHQGKVEHNGKEVQLVHPLVLDETHSPQNIIRLDPGSIDQLLNPETEHMTYCMGWVRQDYRGRLLLSHSGTIDGFRAHIKLAPKENIGIVLLNNRHGTDMNLALGNTLLDRLLELTPHIDWNEQLGKVAKMRDDYDKQKFKAREAQRHRGTKPSLPNSGYVGKYREPAFGEARVTEEDGKLMWHWSTFSCPLKHFHYDIFIAESELLHDPFVQFALGLDGTAVTMNAIERYFVRVPEK
jgi:CubicO group peptidase (beta-lactamase class C family)